jgi:hypothetical protein
MCRLFENEYMTIKTNIFTTHGTDILLYKKGGGRIALFGLPFFLVGLFVAQIPFGIIPVDVEGGPIVLAILFPLGPLFAGVGFVLMLSRSGFIIDRNIRTLVHWWGLLIPMKKTVYNLDSFAKVHIEFRAGDKNSSDIFPISLVGAGSQASLPIVDLIDYEMALETAHELARFTGKSLEDTAIDSEYTEPLQ